MVCYLYYGLFGLLLFVVNAMAIKHDYGVYVSTLQGMKELQYLILVLRILLTMDPVCLVKSVTEAITSPFFL